jgi:thiamine pyrophosphokinase
MHAIVAAGGDLLDETWHSALATDALIVAADSGLAQVYALGRVPNVVVGDFDSVDPKHLARAELDGARIERHPIDKDATDLELALEITRQLGASEVTVIGAGGGRLDHHLAALALLAAPELAAMRITALVGSARLTVVHDHVSISGRVGSTVTLLAVGGSATGVSTTGLRWALADATLSPTSTRGVSNEVTDSPATISVRGGTLFVIQPTGGH